MMGSRVRQLLLLPIVLLLGWNAALPAQSTQPATEPATQPATRPATPAAVVALQGMIDDYSRNALFSRFDAARKQGARTIILSIDTWGGAVHAALEISQYIKQQDDLHVIAFVKNKAISAGAMIALACDELVMQPSSQLGDCAPIAIGSEGDLKPLPPTERAKMESPILADFRESARRNGYDQLLVEAMVTVDRTVYFVQNEAAERRFVDAEDYKSLLENGWSVVPGVPAPVDRENELLTVDAELAIKLGLSRGTFRSVDDLAAERNLDIVARLNPGIGEHVIDFLSSPIVRMLLMSMFSLSMWIALNQPGHGAPEAIALTSLGLILGVPLLTGYAQWWEILLIFGGLALIAFELFVFPGHMVSLITGALMMLGGLVMTFVPKEPTGLPGVLPQLSGSWDALQSGLLAVAGALVASIALWLWLQRYLPKMPYFNRLVLVGSGTPDSVSAPPQPERWPVVGMHGQAMTDLRPGGTGAFFDAAIGDTRAVSVITDRGFVAAGSKLKITEVSGNRIVVRPLENTNA